MSSLEECMVAKRIVHDTWQDSLWRARHILSANVFVPIDPSPSNDGQAELVIGTVNRRRKPDALPGCAPYIAARLGAAGLDVEVRYVPQRQIAELLLAREYTIVPGI